MSDPPTKIGDNHRLATRFPGLLQPAWHDPVRCHFELANDPPPDDQIGNVTIVPFVGERVVVLRLANGAVEVPGGTLEANETYLDALRRELDEEVGATLGSFAPFGFWRCESSATQPYRPHLPHPRFCRLVGYGEVVLIGSPSNPPDGEQVLAVEVIAVSEAAIEFNAINRPDLADLYRLASELRINTA